MITRARFFFGEDGDYAVDFHVQEGKRTRAVARTAAQLAVIPLPAPIRVSTYGELFAALTTLGAALKDEDVQEEVRIVETERVRRETEAAKQAALDAEVAARETREGRAP